jgi:hypothetical protein
LEEFHPLDGMRQDGIPLLPEEPLKFLQLCLHMALLVFKCDQPFGDLFGETIYSRRLLLW